MDRVIFFTVWILSAASNTNQFFALWDVSFLPITLWLCAQVKKIVSFIVLKPKSIQAFIIFNFHAHFSNHTFLIDRDSNEIALISLLGRYWLTRHAISKTEAKRWNSETICFC